MNPVPYLLAWFSGLASHRWRCPSMMKTSSPLAVLNMLRLLQGAAGPPARVQPPDLPAVVRHGPCQAMGARTGKPAAGHGKGFLGVGERSSDVALSRSSIWHI